MRFLSLALIIFALGFILGFILVTFTCNGQATVKDIYDNLDKPPLEHPDDASIEFSESVNERDRRLMIMAVDIARPLFENAGFSLSAEIYIAGDKDSYIELAQTKFNMPPQKALKYYTSTRGSTLVYYGRILINIPFHDDFYTGDRRDGTLVFTLVHELDHVLQAKLSSGWSALTDEPVWLGEHSANLFASQATINAFCKPFTEVASAASSFSRESECPNEFVEEKVLDSSVVSFFEDRTIYSVIEIYLVARFGINAYDNFYKALSDSADSFRGNIEAAREQLWPLALKKAFGAPSVYALLSDAAEYMDGRENELAQRIKKYYP